MRYYIFLCVQQLQQIETLKRKSRLETGLLNTSQDPQEVGRGERGARSEAGRGAGGGLDRAADGAEEGQEGLPGVDDGGRGGRG